MLVYREPMRKTLTGAPGEPSLIMGRSQPGICKQQTHAMRKDWYKLLPEQVLNAGIVAGIVALSTLGDWMVVGKAAGLAFLLELRKYLDRGRTVGD